MRPDGQPFEHWSYHRLRLLEQAAELAERVRGLHPPEVRRLGLAAVLQPLAPRRLGLKPSEPTRPLIRPSA